jgi:hypothetical protein
MLTLTGAGGPPHHTASSFDSIAHSLPYGLAGLVVAVLGALTMTFVMKALWERRRSNGNGRREPPLFAEALLCVFARPKDREALMGDFEELFAQDCALGMSGRRASTRYWARVLRSIGPQMWQAVRRVGLLGLIAAALRR